MSLTLLEIIVKDLTVQKKKSNFLKLADLIHNI